MTQCNWNSGLNSVFKRVMLNKYPLIVSCLVIGSLNFTTSSYAVRSIPWSSKRCGRSSYKKPTNRSTSTVDFGGLWSTRLSPMAHLMCFWSALSLRVELLFLKYWRGSLVVVGLVGLSRWEVRRTAGIGRKLWWESWVLAICLGSKFKWCSPLALVCVPLNLLFWLRECES